MGTISYQQTRKSLFLFEIFVSMILVFTFVSNGYAAYTPQAGEEAASRMTGLKLITAPSDGDLHLDSEITRADLVVLLVRAFGQETNAQLLKGAAAYVDTANHWASGYIAVAKSIVERNGESIGLPDGTFNPDGRVTAAETVSFIMKFLGVKPDSSLSWPENYLQKAVASGVISADDADLIRSVANTSITRGFAIYLVDFASYHFQLSEGGTLYTTYVDSVKPALTIDSLPSSTQDNTVTITGTVSEDTVSVLVGPLKNQAMMEQGKYQATVTLQPNKENTIRVSAIDLAGNKTESSVKVVQGNPTPSSQITVNVDWGSVIGEVEKPVSMIEVYREGKLLDKQSLGESYNYVEMTEFYYGLLLPQDPSGSYYSKPKFLPGDRIVLLNPNTPEAIANRTPEVIYEFVIPTLDAALSNDEQEGVTVISGKAPANGKVTLYRGDGGPEQMVGQVSADSQGEYQYSLRPGLQIPYEHATVEYKESQSTVEILYQIQKQFADPNGKFLSIDYPMNKVYRPGDMIALKLRLYESNGESVPISQAEWSIDSTDAVIDASGNFTASKPGTYTVTASVPAYNLSTETTVSVVELSEPAKIYFVPKNMMSSFGRIHQPIEFDVDLQDANGNRLYYNGSFHWEIEKYDESIEYGDPRDPDGDQFIPSFDATMTVDRIFTANTAGRYQITLTSDAYPSLPKEIYHMFVLEDVYAISLTSDKTELQKGEQIDLQFNAYDSQFNPLPLDYIYGENPRDQFQYQWNVEEENYNPAKDSFDIVNGENGIIQFYRAGDYRVYLNLSKHFDDRYYPSYSYGAAFVDVHVTDPTLEQIEDIGITNVNQPVFASKYDTNWAHLKVEAIDAEGKVIPGVAFDYESTNSYDTTYDQYGNVSVAIHGNWDGYYLLAKVRDKPTIQKKFYIKVYNANYQNIGSVELNRADENGTADERTIYTKWKNIGYSDQYMQGYPLEIKVKDNEGGVIPTGDWENFYTGTAYLSAEYLDGTLTDAITFSQEEFYNHPLFYASKAGDYRIIARSVDNPDISQSMVIHVVDRGQAIRTTTITRDEEQMLYTDEALSFGAKAYDGTGNVIDHELFKWTVYNEDGSQAQDVTAMEYGSPLDLEYSWRSQVQLNFPRSGLYKIVAVSSSNPLIKSTYEVSIMAKPALAGVSYSIYTHILSGSFPDGANAITIQLNRDDQTLETRTVQNPGYNSYYEDLSTWSHKPAPGDTIVLSFDNGTEDAFLIQEIQAVYDAKNQTLIGKAQPNQSLKVSYANGETSFTERGSSSDTGRFEIPLSAYSISKHDAYFDVSTLSSQGVEFTTRVEPIAIYFDPTWNNLQGYWPANLEAIVSVQSSSGAVKLSNQKLDPPGEYSYTIGDSQFKLYEGDRVTLQLGDLIEDSIPVQFHVPVTIDNVKKTITGKLPVQQKVELQIQYQSVPLEIDRQGHFTASFAGLTDYWGDPILNVTTADLTFIFVNPLLEMKVGATTFIEPTPSDYDHNDDGKVDEEDLQAVKEDYGKQTPVTEEAETDVNHDRIIDLFDIIKQAKNTPIVPASLGETDSSQTNVD